MAIQPFAKAVTPQTSAHQLYRAIYVGGAGPLTMPSRLFGLARVASFCRLSWSNCNREGYFKLNIASLDIKWSTRERFWFGQWLGTVAKARQARSRKPALLTSRRKVEFDLTLNSKQWFWSKILTENSSIFYETFIWPILGTPIFTGFLATSHT